MKADDPQVELGVLGRHVDDGDECYGLYISLAGAPVLVDIREDALRGQREDHARRLFAGQPELEASLERFRRANPEFASRRITSIGLHSKVSGRAEVFWEPDGYTLLRDLEFVADGHPAGGSWFKRLTGLLGGR